MDQEPIYIGVDIGGTKIMIVLITEDGSIKGSLRLDTRSADGADKTMDRIAEGIKECSTSINYSLQQVKAIGLGVPGPLNLEKQEVTLAPNLGWENVPVIRMLKERIDLPCYMENDANVAAWGEKVLGAGKPFENFIYLTISTGIGGGLILNNKLYSGAWGAGGELGHMIIEPGGRECTCGSRGCLEAMASGQAIENMARELATGKSGDGLLALNPEEIDGKTVTDLARQGDPAALSIMKEITFYLGIGLANFVHIFNPQAIILGGGVMEASELLLGPVEEEMKKHLLPGFNGRLKILAAELEDMVGAKGAAMLAREFQG